MTYVMPDNFCTMIEQMGMTAEELRAYRVEFLGLTQKEFAEKLGLSERHYIRLETEELPIGDKVRRMIDLLIVVGELEKPMRATPSRNK